MKICSPMPEQNEITQNKLEDFLERHCPNDKSAEKEIAAIFQNTVVDVHRQFDEYLSAQYEEMHKMVRVAVENGNRVDLGDVTWDQLNGRNRGRHPYENFIRLLYYKWVYPWPERSSDTRIGSVDLIVEDDGKCVMRFLPRFKIQKHDIEMLKSQELLDETFPPDADEMKELAAKYEEKWAADREKWKQEHPEQANEQPLK